MFLFVLLISSLKDKLLKLLFLLAKENLDLSHLRYNRNNGFVEDILSSNLSLLVFSLKLFSSFPLLFSVFILNLSLVDDFSSSNSFIIFIFKFSLFSKLNFSLPVDSFSKEINLHVELGEMKILVFTCVLSFLVSFSLFKLIVFF